jgi:hypothetical protein
MALTNMWKYGMRTDESRVIIWISFEWGGKTLKCPGLDGRDAKDAFAGLTWFPDGNVGIFKI